MLNENYTYHALIPRVLARGTAKHPDRKSIKRLMQELYGASFAADIRKLGNKQIMSFGMDVVDDQYINSDLFCHAADFLHELIFEPCLEDGLFRQDYVVQESQNLKQQILSIVNDKAEYSAMRLNQIMNEGADFTKCVFGDADELDNIDAQKIYSVYSEIMSTHPVDIFVVGDVDESRVKQIVAEKFNFKNRITLPEYIAENKYPTQVHRQTENMDVKQAKLNIGFRTNITASSSEYVKLCMFNEIFGGGLNSKLFMNVRERASLCYTVYSALDKFNGQLFVYTGINPENDTKAYEIIKEQLRAIIDGDISDFEMEAAQKEYRTRLKAVNDSAAAMVNYTYSNIMVGAETSAEELLDEIMQVTKADIVEMANAIMEDTVFLLTVN